MGVFVILANIAKEIAYNEHLYAIVHFLLEKMFDKKMSNDHPALGYD